MPHTDKEFAALERALREALACIERQKASQARFDARLAKFEKQLADYPNLLEAMGATDLADKVRAALKQAQCLN